MKRHGGLAPAMREPGTWNPGPSADTVEKSRNPALRIPYGKPLARRLPPGPSWRFRVPGEAGTLAAVPILIGFEDLACRSILRRMMRRLKMRG